MSGLHPSCHGYRNDLAQGAMSWQTGENAPESFKLKLLDLERLQIGTHCQKGETDMTKEVPKHRDSHDIFKFHLVKDSKQRTLAPNMETIYNRLWDKNIFTIFYEF